jgi:hypothetical protein
MNYEIFPISVKKFDLFDSSPKWIHRHTICVGIEVSTKKMNSKINYKGKLIIKDY